LWLDEFANDELADRVLFIASDEPNIERAIERAIGAIRFLTHDDVARQFSRIVVEGAPGRGKSTVTQYLCQLHRLIVLDRTADLAKVPKQNLPATLQVPFR
jgi:hypothetical protein